MRSLLMFSISLAVSLHAQAKAAEKLNLCGAVVRSSLETATAVQAADPERVAEFLRLAREYGGRFAKLEEEEKRRLHLQLIQLADNLLTEQGIAHTVQDVLPWPRITIDPLSSDSSSRSFLKRVRASLARRDPELQVIYSPRELAASESRGLYRRPQNALLLSHAAVASAHELGLRQSNTLHEILHWSDYLALKKRRPSPFHGYVAGADFFAEPPYADGFNFEELHAWSVDAQSSKARLRRIATRQVRVAEEAFLERKSHATFTLAMRALEVVDLFEKGARGPISYRYNPDWRGIEARFTLTRAGASAEVAIPLVKSRGPADPANRRLLSEQLESLRDAAISIARRFDDGRFR